MQIIDLPSPHGDCDPSAGYVRTKCFTDCFSNYVIRNCNCKDTYMSGENVTEWLTGDLFSEKMM